jgi:four helix bundle protein
MSQRFEDLKVWQRAMEMTVMVYKATQSFPANERFGLTSQLRRAAVSVPSNIAEGRGRLSQGEFKHFLGVAQGSNYEVQTQLLVAQSLEYGESQPRDDAGALSRETGMMLSSLIATIQAKS